MIPKSRKLERAKEFLAQLLDDTFDWPNVDTQYELRYELFEILGDCCPEWIFDDFEDEFEDHFWPLTN